MEVQVVVGLGAVGRAVVRALHHRGIPVRAVTCQKAEVDGLEVRTADVTSPSAAREAAEGAAVVYDCTSVRAADRRSVAASLVEGAGAAGARLVAAQTGCMYESAESALTEDRPLRRSPGGDAFAATTALLMEAHRSGKVRATIGRGSEPYGPGIRNGPFGERVFPQALRKERIALLGDPDLVHTFSFVDDLAEGLVALGQEEEAAGAVWNLPSAEPLTPRSLVDLVFEAAFGSPELEAVSSRALLPQALVSSSARENLRTALEFERPYVLDSSSFERAFGKKVTPHREATGKTLSWWRSVLSGDEERASSGPGQAPQEAPRRAPASVEVP